MPEGLRKNGQDYRILTDQIGSVRLVVNSETGEEMQRIDYDEWGQITLDTNPGFQPFGFAGGLYDPDTGLTRFGVRDYDAETGRWTVKDPILFEGGEVGLYGYVGEDPVSRFDPYGLWDFVFNAGFHLPAFPLIGVSGGPSIGSSWKPGEGFLGASYNGVVGEVIIGSIADAGVNSGVGGLSSCQDGKPRSLNFGLGRYGGIQLNFKGNQFDGLTVGVGIGVSLPVTVTVPVK